MGSKKRWGALLVAALLVPACSDGGTDPDVLPDGIPSGITLTVLSTRSLRVDWTDTSSNEAGFEIQVRPAGLGAFITMETVTQGAQSAVVTGLAPDTAYDVQVVAVNVKGPSAAAPFATATTLAMLWSPLTSAPGPLMNVQSAYDSTLNRMILFGGSDGVSVFDNSLRALDFNDGSLDPLTPLSPLPEPRLQPSLIYDSRRNSLILFGGFGIVSGATLNDIWEYDLTSNLWIERIPADPMAAPSPRRGHSAIYDPLNFKMIVFGGFHDESGFPLNDVLRLDLPSPVSGMPITWEIVATAGPTPIPRDSHSAVYDPLGTRMIVFGGNDAAVVGDFYTNELWALALGAGPTLTWSLLASAGPVPSARQGHAAVYDSRNRQMVVFGGDEETLGTPDNRLWTLSLGGGTPIWSEHTFPPPALLPGARTFSAAAFDPTPRVLPGFRMILFGGDTGGLTPSAEFWSLQL